MDFKVGRWKKKDKIEKTIPCGNIGHKLSKAKWKIDCEV